LGPNYCLLCVGASEKAYCWLADTIRKPGLPARSRLIDGQNFSTSNSGCDQVDAYSPQMVDEVFRKSRSPIKAAIPSGRKYERQHHGAGWAYAALWNTH
jgi:hypothetical protein